MAVSDLPKQQFNKEIVLEPTIYQFYQADGLTLILQTICKFAASLILDGVPGYIQFDAYSYKLPPFGTPHITLAIFHDYYDYTSGQCIEIV